MSIETERLRNLGSVSKRWLADAGIADREALERLGAARAFLSARRLGVRASNTLLWAIQGAIYDLPWYELPKEMRGRLLDEVAAVERAARP